MGKITKFFSRISKKLSCVHVPDNEELERKRKKIDPTRPATSKIKIFISDDEKRCSIKSRGSKHELYILSSDRELVVKVTNKTNSEGCQRKDCDSDNLRYKDEQDNDNIPYGYYSGNASTQTDELIMDSNKLYHCKEMVAHSSQISPSSGYESKSVLSLDKENCLGSLLEDEKSYKLYKPEIVPGSIQKTNSLDGLSATSTESLNFRDPTIWLSQSLLQGTPSSLSFLSDDFTQSFVGNFGMDDFYNIRQREFQCKDLHNPHTSQQLGTHCIPCRSRSSSTSDLMLNSSSFLISLSAPGMQRQNKATQSHSSCVSFCTEQPCENVCAESLLYLHTDSMSLARSELQCCSLDSGSIHQDYSDDWNSSSNSTENGFNSNEENLGRRESKTCWEMDAENDLEFSKHYVERTCQIKEACLQSLESDSDLFGESGTITNTTDGHSSLPDPARSVNPVETDLNEKSSSAGDVIRENTVSYLLTRESSRENFCLKGDITVDLDNAEKKTTEAAEENKLCYSLKRRKFWNMLTNIQSDLKNAKGIYITFPKSKQEPNFDVREAIWICFLDEVNGKHHVSEFHFFLVRFCPWLVNSKQRHFLNENSKNASHFLCFFMCTPSLKKEINHKSLSLKTSSEEEPIKDENKSVAASLKEETIKTDEKDENMLLKASLKGEIKSYFENKSWFSKTSLKEEIKTDEDGNLSPTGSLRVEKIPGMKDVNVSFSASFHEQIVKSNMRDENKEDMNPDTRDENISTTASEEEKMMKTGTKDESTCMPITTSLEKEMKHDTEDKNKNKRNRDIKVENVSILASFSRNHRGLVYKTELGKERETLRNSGKRRHSHSVNSLMTEPCNERPIQQNTDSKTSAETHYRMVLNLQQNGIRENYTNSRFKLEYKLTDTTKIQEIRRIVLRCLERFDAKRQRTSLSSPLLSCEKFEHLSLPEMIYKLNAISKGLTGLRRYLRVSNDFRITSVDFTTVPMQQSAQQTQGSTNNVFEQLDEPNMDTEWSRFTTFQNYPASVGVSAVKLAKHGFYYTGNGSETRCHFCSGTYSEWNSTSDVEAIHQQISPDCPLANGSQTNNVPIHTSRNLPLSHVDDIFRGRTNEGSTRDPTNADSTAQGQTEQAEAGEPTAQGQTEQAHAGDPTAQGQTEQAQAGDPTAQGQTEQSQAGDPTAQGQTEQAQASQEEKDSIQSTGVTSSPQVMSKSKLKREKKKKKKEAQAKTKTESISSQEVSGPASESRSLTESASSSSSVTPGLVIKEVQYNPHETEAGRATRQGFSSESGATSNSTDSHLLKSGSEDHKNTHTSSSNVSTKSQSDVRAGGQLRGGGGGGGGAPDPEQGGTSLSGQPQHGANPPSSTPGSVAAAGTPGPSPSERLAQLDPLGINFDRPKYPAYAVYSTRLSSFDGWPSHMAQTPREMARAGYFYAGYGDYARCFFCGGGLRNWDRSDDPWTEHAHWFPRCAFLRNNRGNKFVATVQRTHEEQEAGLRPSTRFLNPPERDMDTPAAEALREMGYRDRIIEQAIDQWRRSLWPGRIQPPPLSADRLLDIIEDIQRTEEGRPSEGPLTIPGVHDETVESPDTGCNVGDSAVARATTGEREEDSATTGQREEDSAVALEENRSDDQLVQAQPRDYGYDQKEKQEKQVLEEDYLGLRETLVCKICREKDVAAAFLPCGHLVCCLDCAPAMRKCPTCGEVIKGTVKTYFA